MDAEFIVAVVFAVLVGLLLGALLALIVDDYRLGRRLKTAVAQKRELEEKFKTTMNRLTTAETKLKETSRNYSAATSQIAQLNTEIEKLQQQVKTAETETTAAQENLNRVCMEMEDLLTDNRALRQKVETADARHEELQAQLTGLLRQLTETQTLRKKILTAEETVKAYSEQMETLQSRLTLVQRHMKANDKNELVIIKGIGPKYAQRLREAGIVTLADLANQTPERLAEVLKLKNWQAVDTAAWIEEAQHLAGNRNEQPKG